MSTSINLLGTTSRVETPIIGVRIGDAVLGVYSQIKDGSYSYIINPNYLKSLEVKKINGTVNHYTLKLDYPITQNSDPNYIDKILASVADTRKIKFGYGDASVPAFLYREETAVMFKVRKRATASASVKSYTIYAVSTGALSIAGSYKFRKRHDKPSDVIKEILYEPKYGLTQVFYGMTDRNMVERLQLIRSDDAEVDIEAKSNISVLDYLSYLVDCMSPATKTNDSMKMLKKCFYVLLFEDGVDSDIAGPYFRVERSDRLREKSSAYEIDVGYPSQNVVTSWEVEDDETYSLLYKYSAKIQPNMYQSSINDKGEIVQSYSPIVGSNSPLFKVTEEEKTWWTKVTQFPIKATITFKGLLRPAILMSYVRINILYYGQKDIDSGLYVVTSQYDSIDLSGYRTTLKLLRVGGDDTYVN